jgi:hypothetical protein
MAKQQPSPPAYTIADDRKPWEYGHRVRNGQIESTRSFQFFVDYYLPLGPTRSAKSAARAAGAPSNTLQKYSADGDWPERARAWDAHNASQWRTEEDAKAKAAYQGELRKFREDQQKRARALGRVADLMICATTRTLEEMEASGGLIDPEQLATVARASASLVEVSMNTAAAALGVSDVLEALDSQE